MTFQANIPQPGAAPQGMSFFSGVPASDTAISVVNWRRFDSVAGRVEIIRDSTKLNTDTLAIILDSMKWINADKFSGSASMQTFDIKLSAIGASISNTSDIRSYILIDTLSSMMWAPYRPDATTVSAACPSTPVHFIVFGLIDKKFYGGVYATTPSSGSNYNVTLTEVKPEDFKVQLNNLTK